MIKLYQDKKWLENKYQEQILLQKDIGKICKVAGNTIGVYLRKFNITCRSRSEINHLRQSNHCNLSKEAIEWINGELLGDGCLQSLSLYSARFQYSSKYLEYIEYVRNKLKSFGIEQSGKIHKSYHKDMDCYSYKYCSLSYVELLPVYKQWYPKGKKIVPKDIELTPLTCRQWFIGDGSLLHREKRRPHIVLSTCGFLISDVEWLIKQLDNLGFKVTRRPSKNIIYLSSYSTKEFLNYIGECLVKCYQYKWAY